MPAQERIHLRKFADPAMAGAFPEGESAFPGAESLRSRDILRLIKEIWPFVRPYRRHLLYLCLLLIPGLVIGLVSLSLVRVMFDVVGNGHPLKAYEAWMLQLPIGASREVVLWHVCMIAALIAAITVPLLFATMAYAVWLLQRINNLFRVTFFSRLQQLGLRFHAREKIGTTIFNMFQDSAAAWQVLDGLILLPVRLIPEAIGVLLFLFALSAPMAAIAAALIPIDLLIAWAFSSPMRREFAAARTAGATATTRVEETLSAVRAVKAFGSEASERALFARDNWESFITARRARMMVALYRALTNSVRGVAYAGALYLGASEALAGGKPGFLRAAFSLGLFQMAIAVFARAARQTRILTDRWGDLQDVGVALARALAVVHESAAGEPRSGDLIAAAPVASLSFAGVGFSYDGEGPVLSAIGLEAKVGEITAIAGPSGAGKSTLLALALRFFDPTAGQLLLDDRDIRRFDLVSYRALFGTALQETPILSATLRDNLTYGRPDASVADIERALKIAGLADFVASLPAGMETELGEKGARLSHGQAERIGLARALLRDAPILLLDEPTSALDSTSERYVMAQLRKWVGERPGRMVLLATHRRTTAACADRTYQIETAAPHANDEASPRITSAGEAGK